MSDYTPQPDSLAGRVCAFFRQHADEELSQRDIAQKFDTQASTVTALLSACVSHNLLKRSKVGGEAIYSAGAGLAATAPPAPARGKVPSIFDEVSKKPRGRKAPPIDVAEVGIEQNVPLPPARRAIDWPVLLERLKQPQLCSSPLPLSYRASLKAAVDKWTAANGGTYVIRPVSDTHMRIWRTA